MNKKDIIIALLEKHGPSSASKITAELQKLDNVSEGAARQSIRRADTPIEKISILPNKEKFLYLFEQRYSEKFFSNLREALKENNAIHGIALGGMENRGGIVKATEFDVISGAPIINLSKQVASDKVIEKLLECALIKKREYEEEQFYELNDDRKTEIKLAKYKDNSMIEELILIYLKDWVRKINLASYGKVVIRSDSEKREVGAFRFDLTAPSYLFPFLSQKSNTQEDNEETGNSFGFLVADVFAGKIESEEHVDFFLRKINSLKFSHIGYRLLPFLIASGFENKAFNKAKSRGIIVTTPKELFGENVAKAMENLLILFQSMEIKSASANNTEGARLNITGDLFEMVCLYLANIRVKEVEHSVKATDERGKQKEIDILQIVDGRTCVAIECKGKQPKSKVGEQDIKEWIAKFPILKSYLCQKRGFDGDKISFEFWTTSTFTDEALALLEEEKKRRKNNPIDWKQRDDIIELARYRRATRIVEMLKNQFPDR